LIDKATQETEYSTKLIVNPIEFTVKVNKPILDYSVEEQTALLKAIDSVIKEGIPLTITKITTGSILITFIIPFKIANFLKIQIKENRLRDYYIIDCFIENSKTETSSSYDKRRQMEELYLTLSLILTEREATIVKLRFGLGTEPMGYAQISNKLGISIDTAKTTKFRAMNKLKKRIHEVDNNNIQKIMFKLVENTYKTG